MGLGFRMEVGFGLELLCNRLFSFIKLIVEEMRNARVNLKRLSAI